MNLAAGGTFDNGYAPDYDIFTDKNMYVDYVRVFQRQVGENEDEKPDKIADVKTDGANDNLYGDYKLGIGSSPIVTPDPTDTPTVAPTKAPTVKKLAKAKIKKISTKKMAAKKIKLSLKKIKNAKGYQIKVYKTKKNAKKNKKAIVRTFVKKAKITKITIKSKKLKNRKKLYVRARAYNLNGKIKVYGKWSKVKKVKIKK